MAGVTKSLGVAWDRECRGLTLEECGALWALTAAAECGWFGMNGALRVGIGALAILWGMYVDQEGEDDHQESFDQARTLLRSLRKKGKVSVTEIGTERLEIVVCFWNDRWAAERFRKRCKGVEVEA